jgi:hypothetical protein
MRLFVFGIGGTGSRVIEALTFLLASGVEMVDAEKQKVELIPILLDTDATNKDTLDAVSALTLYTQLHSERGSAPGSGFFSSPVGPLCSLAKDANKALSTTFRLNYKGVENKKFGEFIGFDQIKDDMTKHLLLGLYSSDNLSDRLTGGFLGSPNVGSIVLSGLKDSADFSLFANAFTPGDRVFIIGSLFGGTGAAGLPWLAKTLRSQTQERGSAEAIRQAPIGALMVLPYFKLQEDASSHIDSSVFVTKAKAALSYYSRHMSQFNAVYYIADSQLEAYPNHEFGDQQSNDAHVIELLGAIAIAEFARLPNSQCTPPNTNYYECAIDEPFGALNFSNLGLSAKFCSKELTQLQILSLLDEGYFQRAHTQTWAKINGFGADFFDSSDYREHFSAFLQLHYRPWVLQLATNKRSFAAFQDAPDTRDLRHLRVDRPAKKSFLAPPLGDELFDMTANVANCDGYGPKGSMSRFIGLCWNVTEQLYRKCYETR